MEKERGNFEVREDTELVALMDQKDENMKGK